MPLVKGEDRRQRRLCKHRESLHRLGHLRLDIFICRVNVQSVSHLRLTQEQLRAVVSHLKWHFPNFKSQIHFFRDFVWEGGAAGNSSSMIDIGVQPELGYHWVKIHRTP